MMTRLPAWRGTPVPFGKLSTPAPGAQKVSSGSAASPMMAVPGRGPPKHVQPLPPVVVMFDRCDRRRRHEEEGSVMILGASRDELAGNNVRVPRQMRVHQRAVVVVGRTRGRMWLVGVGHRHGDGRDRRGRAREAGVPVTALEMRESGDGQDDRGQDHALLLRAALDEGITGPLVSRRTGRT